PRPPGPQCAEGTAAPATMTAVDKERSIGSPPAGGRAEVVGGPPAGAAAAATDTVCGWMAPASRWQPRFQGQQPQQPQQPRSESATATGATSGPNGGGHPRKRRLSAAQRRQQRRKASSARGGKGSRRSLPAPVTQEDVAGAATGGERGAGSSGVTGWMERLSSGWIG
ncbi:unnamed protein product, partial [Scytosiphon promiscuus]